ncbi:MAG: hypothetical protein ABIG64_02150 [Candidatus Omnitrophota bacterium]
MDGAIKGIFFQGQLKTLIGYIPVCANCEQIRDDQGAWNRMEKYISDRAEVDFTQYLPGMRRKIIQ